MTTKKNPQPKKKHGKIIKDTTTTETNKKLNTT
jgi:hypothetical protein